MITTSTANPQEATVPRRDTQPTQAEIAEAEREVIELGKAALGRIKQTFTAWLEVAAALAIGRRHAMAEAQTDDPDNGRYRLYFSKWLADNPPFNDQRVLPKATRSWLLRCHDHAAEILAWRIDKPLELTRYNFPEQVFKRWARVNRPELLSEQQRDESQGRPAPRRQKESQAAAIDDVVGQLTHVADNIQRAVAGTQLTLDLSTPELIAESAQMIVDIYGAAYGDQAVLDLATWLQELVAGAALTAQQSAPKAPQKAPQRRQAGQANQGTLRLDPEAAAEIVAAADAGVARALLERPLAWTEREGVLPVIRDGIQYIVRFRRDQAPVVEEILQGVPRRVRKNRSVWAEAVRIAELQDDDRLAG